MDACLPCAPTRNPTKHVYYSMTKGLCGTCKASVDVKIVFRDGAVFGLPSRVMLAPSAGVEVSARAFTRLGVRVGLPAFAAATVVLVLVA